MHQWVETDRLGSSGRHLYVSGYREKPEFSLLENGSVETSARVGRGQRDVRAWGNRASGMLVNLGSGSQICEMGGPATLRRHWDKGKRAAEKKK